MRKITTILFALTVCAVNVFAGIIEDSIAVANLSAFFQSDRNADKSEKKEAENCMAAFEVFFGSVAENSKNTVTEILKIAPKFGLKPFPDGVNFVKSLTFFKEKQSEFSLNAYLNALKDCAEDKKIKNFNTIVQFANNLLKNNYLHSTNLIKWLCDGEFSFEQNDAKELIVKFLNTNLACYANRDSCKSTQQS